jgi:glutamate synthase (NADPH/NADH) small chain
VDELFKIIKKIQLTGDIFWMDVLAPRVARSALPGQFIILKADKAAERIPLTISGYDRGEGVVSIVIQVVGKSTKKIVEFEEGSYFESFVGPLGKASELIGEDIESLKQKKILFVAGGLGSAPVYPQVKYLYGMGIDVDVIMGFRNKNLVILEEEMKLVAKNVYTCTDDGSYGFSGNVTMLLNDLVLNQGIKYDLVIAVGPVVMMKFTCLATKSLGIKTIVSMNPIMVDGTGMCGACRLTVGGKVKFACVDGPEFDGHLIDFDEAMRRLRLYETQEGRGILEKSEPGQEHAPNCVCAQADELFNTLEGHDRKKRVPMREQGPKERAANFNEVNFGYSLEEAKLEADRCLNCKKPKCVEKCPVMINIPAFISEIKNGAIDKALSIVSDATSLPAICGRVCPQEAQCEGACIVGIKNEPVAIGRLERYLGDYAIKGGISPSNEAKPNGKKVAIVGSGPAGLACAGDLAKMGYKVKIFEALHEPGGVLTYGIPEFRLPKMGVVAKEIENVKKLGVEIECNVIIGKTTTIDSLMEKEGYEAVFIASGAGLPKFMGIPGENANGVFSANEYLTRSNLMKAFRGDYETPIIIGKKVAVVGGGNVAMDAARTALRLGSEVHIVYRRGESELPARLEEVHHAKEEGIIFNLLTNPVEILADENGWVKGMACVEMELGAPDASGRRRPVVKEGSGFFMEADMVLMSLGTSPNPLIASATNGLEVDKYGCIVIDGNCMTSKKGVFAGGDTVSGAATVILAMGAGREAAKGIDNYLNVL